MDMGKTGSTTVDLHVNGSYIHRGSVLLYTSLPDIRERSIREKVPLLSHLSKINGVADKRLLSQFSNTFHVIIL
jgi:hypothetical protein